MSLNCKKFVNSKNGTKKFSNTYSHRQGTQSSKRISPKIDVNALLQVKLNSEEWKFYSLPTGLGGKAKGTF